MNSLLTYLPPLFLCTLIFMCGIIWQATHTGSLLLAGGALIVFCLYMLMPNSTTAKIIPWAIAAFCIGALRNALHEYRFMHYAHELCSKKITLQGTVRAVEATNKQQMQRLTIELASYKAHGTDTTHCSDIFVQLYCTTTIAVQQGDILTVHDLYVRQPDKASLVTFFKKQGIVATGFFGNKQHYTITPQPTTCTSWLYTKREQLLHTFKSILSARTFLLISSIFLGYKSTRNRTSDVLYEQFQWWGISHYLARSGLHLVIFVFILHLLFMFIPLPFLLKQIAVALSIATYMLLSWSTVSFMRSLVMIFCYLLASMLKLQQHGLHTISVACCAILLYNPTFLFALDFQLSFGLTLALILLHWAQTRRPLQQAISAK